MGLYTDMPGADRRSTTPSPAKRDDRKLKAFVLRKSGHTYCFCYPVEYEKSAIKAARDCKSLEAIDVVALACYLGHDPKELGL